MVLQSTQEPTLEMEARDRAQEVEGSVVLAQEDRFRVQLDDGRSILFVLGGGAGPSMEEMDSWAATGRRVHVRFRTRADYSAVAEEVRRL